MIKLFQSLLISLENVSQQENEDIALVTIYSMFLSFVLTLLALIILI
jgi:hypothetical protein